MLVSARLLICPLLGNGVRSAEFNNEAIFSQAFGWLTLVKKLLKKNFFLLKFLIYKFLAKLSSF